MSLQRRSRDCRKQLDSFACEVLTMNEREKLCATLRKIYPPEVAQMIIDTWGFEDKKEGADNG